MHVYLSLTPYNIEYIISAYRWGNKLSRKHIIYLLVAGLIIIFVMISAFKFPAEGKGPKTFSRDNISFTYPGNWEEAPSLTYPTGWAKSNVTNLSEELGKMLDYPMISVRDINDKDTRFDISNVGFANSLEELVNSYKSAKTYYKPVTGLLIFHEGAKINSENPLTINGMRAYQIISTSHSGKYKYMVIFIEKIPGQQYYQLVFTSKIQKFDQEKNNFDLILKSLKIN